MGFLRVLGLLHVLHCIDTKYPYIQQHHTPNSHKGQNGTKRLFVCVCWFVFVLSWLVVFLASLVLLSFFFSCLFVRVTLLGVLCCLFFSSLFVPYGS